LDGSINSKDNDFVAYLFGSDNTNIKCGKYEGSLDDWTELTGFKVGWVMVKNITESANWVVFDTKRTSGKYLSPNDSSPGNGLGISFYIDDTDGFGGQGQVPTVSKPGCTYIYVAIRETVDGTSFFDTNTEEVIKGFQITDQYGIEPDSPLTKRLGIAELTEQPTGAVQAYVPQGDKYQPIADLSGPLARAQAEAAEANARLAEADAKLEVVQANIEERLLKLEGKGGDGKKRKD
jgi:hypothetical protein